MDSHMSNRVKGEHDGSLQAYEAPDGAIIKERVGPPNLGEKGYVLEYPDSENSNDCPGGDAYEVPNQDQHAEQPRGLR